MSFEEIMHFFRLGLPKRFQTDCDATEVIKVAAKFKVGGLIAPSPRWWRLLPC